VTRLPIRIYGDPILRKKAKPVRKIDDQLSELIEGMIEAMVEDDGVGLAAPQVGQSIRLIVVKTGSEENGEIVSLINPHVVAASGTQDGMEGCLSLPTLRGKVQRHQQVTVQGIVPDGSEVSLEAEGQVARAFEHEIDHLNGVLFVDRAPADTLCWLIPDPDEECGYRLEATSMKEAKRVFKRLRSKQQAEGKPI